MESRFQTVLSKIGATNPIVELRSSGLSSKEIKDLFTSILEPYFEHKGELGRLVSEFLTSEAVSVARINQRPEKDRLLKAVIEIYRASRLVDSNACFTSAAYWEQSILDGMSEYWSQYHLEVDKADLPMEELKYEVFRNIGVITEACLQPVLRDLLTQISIAKGKASALTTIAEMDFGTVVSGVYRHDPVRELVAPSPWGIRLNQWRNMAQHHKTKVDGEVIRGVYGTGKHAKQVSFSRPELLAALTDIHLHWAILRGGRIMFLFDNLEEARPFFGPTQVRQDSLLFQLHSSLAAQGFVLVDVTTSNQETHAIVKDITGDEQRDRLIHCSQFVFPVYLSFQNDLITVDYIDTLGVPVMRFRAKREDLEQVANSTQPFEYLAEKVAFERIKKDA